MINYAICTYSQIEELSQDDKDWLIAQCCQTSWNTVTHSSTAPDEIILKWDAEQSCPLDALEIIHNDYTHAQILSEIQDPHWTPSE